MEFMALLYGDPADNERPGTPEFDDEMAAYGKFAEVAGQAIKLGDALQGPETARSLRAGPGDDALVTSGPFTETTEVLGGFYVLEVESLDEAIDLAKQIPMARKGGVEVRPVVVRTDDTSDGTGERYFAAIYTTEEDPADIPGTPEWDAGAARHGQFIEKHARSLTGGLALQTTATATTVRVRNSETLVTDGPYAETTEVIGGYYVLRAASPDEAVELAKDIPTSPGGGIEVRPIWELGDTGGN